MQVEKLKHVSSDDRFTQRELLRQINRLHLSATSSFKLSDELLDIILFDVPGAPTMADEMNILTKAQGHVLNTLCAYWCCEFNVEAYKDSFAPKNEDDDISIHDENDEESAGSSRPGSSRPGSSRPESAASSGITDRGEEGYDSRADRLPPLTGLAVAAGKMILHPASKSTPPQPLISDSTQNLIQTSKTSVSQTTPTNKFPPQFISSDESDMIKRIHLQQQFSYLQASLRTNHFAGNPLNHYIESSQHQHTNATANLFFWSTVENLLTKDEMRRWQNSELAVRKKINVNYTSLFSCYPLADNIQSLMDLHLKKRSPFLVNLPPDMLEELRSLLPKGLGENILLLAQQHVINELFKVWMDFLVYDHKSFIEICVSKIHSIFSTYFSMFLFCISDREKAADATTIRDTA